MKFRINLKPFPAEPYFTVREHLLKYKDELPTDGLVRRIEKSLRDLLGIKQDYSFVLLDCDKKEVFLQENLTVVTIKDNPETGIDVFLEELTVTIEEHLLDLSYSFPYFSDKIQDYDFILVDPNMSLCIPNKKFALFYRSENVDVPRYTKVDNSSYTRDLYLISSVLDDLKTKGMDQLIRESNYKSAVLYQLFDSNPNFKLVSPKEKRSRAMIVVDTSIEMIERINHLGYEITHKQLEDLERITIANYATHSKELIEMFADRVAAI